MNDFIPLNPLGDEKAPEENASDSIAKEAKDLTTDSEIETVIRADEPGVDKNSEKVDAAPNEKQDDVVEEIVDGIPDTLNEELMPDKFDELIEIQKKILEGIESLSSLFNARIMHQEHEEKIVDQMHKELQKYKEDMYSQLVRPILLDIIEVRDSIMRMAATYLAKPEGERNIPNKTFSDYAYDLQDILEKNAVEIYRSKLGDDFIPMKQRIVKKVITTDESLHGKVAESLTCGYSYNERIISAEKITIYYYEKSVEQKNENSEVI